MTPRIVEYFGVALATVLTMWLVEWAGRMAAHHAGRALAWFKRSTMAETPSTPFHTAPEGVVIDAHQASGGMLCLHFDVTDPDLAAGPTATSEVRAFVQSLAARRAFGNTTGGEA